MTFSTRRRDLFEYSECKGQIHPLHIYKHGPGVEQEVPLSLKMFNYWYMCKWSQRVDS